jgi:hypothetical protein
VGSSLTIVEKAIHWKLEKQQWMKFNMVS